jgi:hypothetical protein
MSCEDAGRHGAHPQLARTEKARGSNPLTSTSSTNADPPRILRLLVRRGADENALLHTAPATNALLPHTIAGRAWSEQRIFIRYGKLFCGGESSDREMGERNAKVSELLHEAAETHRLTFRITDGADDDWRPGIRSGSSGCPSCPA